VFALADIVKAAMKITAILPEQNIKSAVKGFVWDFTFWAVHDRPDFVVLGSLWYGI
jgi:hypothetical protein